MSKRGVLGGLCFLPHCRSEKPANFLNHFTGRFYCPGCAERINSNRATAEQARHMYGHSLLTEKSLPKPKERKPVVRESQWTDEQDDTIARMYGLWPVGYIAEKVGVTRFKLKMRILELGIHKNEPIKKEKPPREPRERKVKKAKAGPEPTVKRLRALDSTNYRVVVENGRQVILLGKNTRIQVRPGRKVEDVIRRIRERDEATFGQGGGPGHG